MGKLKLVSGFRFHAPWLDPFSYERSTYNDFSPHIDSYHKAYSYRKKTSLETNTRQENKHTLKLINL